MDPPEPGPDADPPEQQPGDDPEPEQRPASPRPDFRTIDEYNQHLALNPDDAAAYYGRGNLYLNHDKYDQAIKDYGKAIELNPQFSEAYHQREPAYTLKLRANQIWGYKSETIEGFHVLPAAHVLAHNDDPAYQRKPLAVLKSELVTVAGSLPSKAVRALRSILIWVEWHDAEDPDLSKGVIAKYYAVGKGPGIQSAWSLSKHKHP
jgi:tetratricopeptide (TPR) repeat protein